ncbi:MAG: DUF4845 domain-containing protein [Casimicrobiaceae bacterium]
MMTISQRRQRGLSMIGFLFVAVVVVSVALLAFRMMPSYIEFYTVQKALEAAVTEPAEVNTASVRRVMDRKLSADYVDSVNPRDVEVTKNGNVITASVSWQKKLPLLANVSLLLDFDASASK